MRTKFALFLLILFALFTSVEGQIESKTVAIESATARELIKLNQELINALASGNKSVVDRIYGKDFVRISIDGELLTKAQLLAALKVPEAGTKTVYESLDIQVFDYGKTAVLTYLSIRHREVKGEKLPDFYYRVADTFVKRAGRWEKVISTGTPIPAKNTLLK